MKKKEAPVAENKGTAKAAPTAMKLETPKEKKVKAPKEKKEKPVKTDAKTVEILSALYGIKGTTVEVKDIVKVGRKVSNKMIGSDPVKGTKKELFITATVNGAKVEKTFAEGEKITF